MSKNTTYQERVDEERQYIIDMSPLAEIPDANIKAIAKRNIAMQSAAIRSYAGNLDMGDCVDWFLEDNGYVEPKTANDETL